MGSKSVGFFFVLSRNMLNNLSCEKNTKDNCAFVRLVTFCFKNVALDPVGKSVKPMNLKDVIGFCLLLVGFLQL